MAADAVVDLLYGFLIHVPNPAAAAGKLLTEMSVSDIFEVGAAGNGDREGR